LGWKKRTSNIERPTSNVEVEKAAVRRADLRPERGGFAREFSGRRGTNRGVAEVAEANAEILRESSSLRVFPCDLRDSAVR
jgi:hypothetical protein